MAAFSTGKSSTRRVNQMGLRTILTVSYRPLLYRRFYGLSLSSDGRNC